ncbi:3-deoxy-D-manno-octulosonic acid transferase [Pedobacter ginsengisoli]|uniref:3-deoxy-D-manno-octulosonic acid transferase n=1 Tax=Pedobacter ginsengisoli TaxID=363852 RepID=A0A2D1U7X5_9SPHI|nr:glycosyltransferase N-terminal domain-containing protein [Pedobacter ginsengisoli]ATP57698.1 3-deoxy-D-manno-octulosonic acid transferase [Pedobacter ginsengisoli]
MLLLYNSAIQLYGLIIKIFSLFNNKAKLFVQGRKNIFKKIQEKVDPVRSSIWFHFASLGEFEQGRPLLEKIKSTYPHKQIVITFFSPSGYEIRKNYALANGVFYLPLDTPSNAKQLIAAINPEIAVFTKYEYWYHYFEALHKSGIPLYIISGIFRPNQIFFKWYGSFNRKILSFVTHFFVQNEESKQLLSQINLQNVSISGDTRFDRVAENAESPKEFETIRKFCGNTNTLIAGSTWPADERLLAELINSNPDWKFIIAPHEIDKSHIDEIVKLIPNAVKYSALTDQPSDTQTLIIDNIGLLSSIYQYGKMAYIGGGFGVGIHNTLEAAAYGIPVIFGPKYDKFQEAKDLISINAAISINSAQELTSAFNKFATHKTAGIEAKNYVNSKTGSTDQIIKYIAQNF